jgi:Sel1 repeat
MSSNRRLAAFFRDNAARQRLKGSDMSSVSEMLASDFQEAAEGEAREREASETRLRDQARRREDNARHEEEMGAQEEVADRLESILEAIEAPRRAQEERERREQSLADLEFEVVPQLERLVSQLEGAKEVPAPVVVSAWLQGKSIIAMRDELQPDEPYLHAKIENLIERLERFASVSLQVPSAKYQFEVGIYLIRGIKYFGLERHTACPPEWKLWHRSFSVLNQAEITEKTTLRESQIQVLARFVDEARAAVVLARSANIIHERVDGGVGCAEWLEALIEHGPEAPGCEVPWIPKEHFFEMLTLLKSDADAVAFTQVPREDLRAQLLEVLQEAQQQAELLHGMRLNPIPTHAVRRYQGRRPQFEIEDLKVGYFASILLAFVVPALTVAELAFLGPMAFALTIALGLVLGRWYSRSLAASKRLRGTINPLLKLLQSLIGAQTGASSSNTGAAVAQIGSPSRFADDGPPASTQLSQSVKRMLIIATALASAFFFTRLFIRAPATPVSLPQAAPPSRAERHASPTGGAVTEQSAPRALLEADLSKMSIPELEAAAQHRVAAADAELGVRFQSGKGVPKRLDSAIEHYQLAALAGDARALTNLGWMATLGTGMLRDDAKALALFEAAAKQNYPNAQDSLGFMYEHGRGVAVDLETAASWYAKAADQGFAKAQDNLKRLSRQ